MCVGGAEIEPSHQQPRTLTLAPKLSSREGNAGYFYSSVTARERLNFAQHPWKRRPPATDFSALSQTCHISQLAQDPKCHFFPSLVPGRIDCFVARLYLKRLTITGSDQYL